MKHIISNNDTGSLHVGDFGSHLKVGDTVHVAGETNARKITYIMGAGSRTHVCCRGTGPFPCGEVEVDLNLDLDGSTPTDPKAARAARIAELQALLQEQEEEVEEVEEVEEAIEV